ncbi:unnamed protein product [Cylindrotheca closterium]|uniref:Uncharacterized protein n=1 Tax=Cylindrotheca closterium TaxID=2856 RepID=A0AAD2FG48_9STRA|nr:unnamed protein product [Cylindrotheca closterium]
MATSSTSPDTSTTATFVTTRDEIQEAAQRSSFGSSSPRGIIDFLDDEAEANQYFILQRLNGSINHFSITTGTPEALLTSPSSHLPVPIVRLTPRHDCVNSLWNHSNAGNGVPSRTQVSPRQQATTPQHLTPPQPTLEFSAGGIPSNLLLPLDF